MDLQVEQVAGGEPLLDAQQIGAAEIGAALAQELGVAGHRLHPHFPIHGKALLEHLRPFSAGVSASTGFCASSSSRSTAAPEAYASSCRTAKAPSSPPPAPSRATPAPAPCRCTSASRAGGPRGGPAGPSPGRGTRAGACAEEDGAARRTLQPASRIPLGMTTIAALGDEEALAVLLEVVADGRCPRDVDVLVDDGAADPACRPTFTFSKRMRLLDVGVTS